MTIHKSTNIQDGETCRHVPVVNVDDDDEAPELCAERFDDEIALVQDGQQQNNVDQEDVVVADVEMGRLTLTNAADDFVPRLPRGGDLSVPQDANNNDGLADSNNGKWTEQESNDFWTCCLAQGLCGLLGSSVVYCFNAHRADYPTRHAWNGCCTAYGVALFIYMLIQVGWLLGGDGY